MASGNRARATRAQGADAPRPDPRVGPGLSFTDLGTKFSNRLVD